MSSDFLVIIDQHYDAILYCVIVGTVAFALGLSLAMWAIAPNKRYRK